MSRPERRRRSAKPCSSRQQKRNRREKLSCNRRRKKRTRPKLSKTKRNKFRSSDRFNYSPRTQFHLQRQPFRGLLLLCAKTRRVASRPSAGSFAIKSETEQPHG